MLQRANHGLTSGRSSSCAFCAWANAKSAALAFSLSCTHHQQSRRSQEAAPRRHLASSSTAIYP